jgi:hypothetical protein
MPKPPNLKDSNPCSECRHFDGTGICEKYDWSVADEDTCDSFTPATTDQKGRRLWQTHRRRLAKEKEA